ncbi:hypothetical protein GCM10022226_61840 [Sphaerisporangium flaviroseum]|uniref:Uncharacterized protein n=1 Tax=Sphaerisporangium flaviroseum TaxID=509199 RepID=A0ABP7J146_9ACTN
MSTDISGSITRDEIARIVDLLIIRPDEPYFPVEIESATINGVHENPISVSRLYREVQEVLEEDRDEDKESTPERLFDTHWDGGEAVVKPKEEYDPDEDRRVAMEIIRKLTARFPLTDHERNTL